MQAKTFYVNVRNAGFDMTLEEVAQMIEDWYAFYPEVKQMLDLQIDGYVPASTFDKTKSTTEEDSEDDVEDELTPEDSNPQALLRDVDGNVLEDENRMVKLFRTTNALGMVKAKGTKCAVANFNFQSYAAAANKIAMWWVYYTEWKRAHDTNTKWMFDIVNFIHDELIFEVDIDALDEVYKRNADLMVRGVKSVMPGVLIKVEGEAMTRWSKAAEPTFDEAGHLIPVEITV